MKLYMFDSFNLQPSFCEQIEYLHSVNFAASNTTIAIFVSVGKLPDRIFMGDSDSQFIQKCLDRELWQEMICIHSTIDTILDVMILVLDFGGFCDFG